MTRVPYRAIGLLLMALSAAFVIGVIWLLVAGLLLGEVGR